MACDAERETNGLQDNMEFEYGIDGEEEAREEVAEAVQQQRRERLRDDVLGMVCPADWTVQAPEPPGNKLTVASLCSLSVEMRGYGLQPGRDLSSLKTAMGRCTDSQYVLSAIKVRQSITASHASLSPMLEVRQDSWAGCWCLQQQVAMANSPCTAWTCTECLLP